MNDDLTAITRQLQDLAVRIARACNDPNSKPNFLHWSDAGNLLLAIEEIESAQRKQANVEEALNNEIKRGLSRFSDYSPTLKLNEMAPSYWRTMSVAVPDGLDGLK